MPSTPRTWTLSWDCYEGFSVEGDGIADRERIEVIEKEPILDLLEGIYISVPRLDESLSDAIHAVLGEHGRLGGNDA